MAKNKEEIIDLENTEEQKTYTCLRNETITVKYLPKASSLVKNPKHVLYGGLGEGCFRDFVVPKYASNGAYYNVLTNAEKKFLEETMGMAPNRLSIYNTENNFWDDFKVRLTKDPIKLDLRNPMDYIKYKVLLANGMWIAKSLNELEDRPLATYQFVMVSEKEVDDNNLKKFNTTSQAYMLLGQYRYDIDTLRVLLECLDGRPVSNRISTESAIARLNEYIEGNAKLFVKFASDPLLNTKVVIKKCAEEHLIIKKGTYYYLASDNSPLCEENAEPILSVAAAYLANPKHQELLFSLQEKLKNK